MSRLKIVLFAAVVMFMAVPANALLYHWQNAVAPASPGFVATNVADGLYDIGTYGGEQTYEFVVKSNPNETQASMCLIGRRQFGDTQAGLKFDQWNNTGEYGATLFGVVDLYFGVPNNPGVDTHLVFVSSEAAGTTSLYVNGVYKASVNRAISLSGIVGIGYGAQGADGSGVFDDFDGVIHGVAIYDGALSDADIQAHSDAFFTPGGNNVVWVSFHGADDAPSGGAVGVGFAEAVDKPYTDLLKANGYNVTRYLTTNNPDAELLNAADLVIISRSVSSGGYQNDGATRWNNISAPMMIVNGYVLRNSRMGYTTGGTMVDTTGDITLTVNNPTHPILTGIPLTNGTMDNPYAGIATYPTDGTKAAGVSINTDPVNAEGTILATISEAGNGPVGGMVIAEWPAGATLTHSGGAGTDVLAGPRVVLLTGARENGGKSSETAGMYDLYPDGEKMFLNAVALYAGTPTAAVADVTAPGDELLGIPRGLPCGGSSSANYNPCGELPPLVIDNNPNTKYLSFGGNFDPGEEPSGFLVTPSAGPTLVTGMTFTTANDAAPRDPTAFELYGSNGTLEEGPYELIAAGEIVDFAQEVAWPRFTKNETPIAFENTVAYDHYQVLFIAIRDAASANSMQIAEVELLGLKLKAGSPSPADGETSVPVDATLSWSGAGSNIPWLLSHDVYFGTEMPLALVSSQAGTTYDPGMLEYGTTYYWQVDEVFPDGSVQPGDVWSFTTTAPVGIFEYTKDIGSPAGIGRTTYEGYVWQNDMLTQRYLLMGGGHDVWDNSDDFHYAYNEVSGDVRVSAGFEWVAKSNDWAKYGVMLRVDDTGPSVHYFMAERGLSDYAGMQGRPSTGGGSSEFGTPWTTGAQALAIQKVTVEGLTLVEGLADFGSGWESRAINLVFDLPDDLLAGVAITSHDNNHLAQARAFDVQYQMNPSLVGELPFPMVPASAALAAPPSDVSGFQIHSLKPLVTDGWGYDAARTIFDTGVWMGLPPQPGSEGTRIDEFVNLRDTGNGVFSEANGYPDASFPGIDPLEIPAADPAAGDDDDNFGTEITACVQLAAGLHIIGANSDDGTIVEIGGVEIGRAGEWKGTSNVDFVFQVEVDGYYNLRALHIEGGGGASVELHEVLLDGTRLLLNDVANGASAVFAP